MPHTWINKLNESNAKTHKEKIITQALVASNIGATDAKQFLQCAWYAYNPFITFNVRQIPTTTDCVNRSNPYNEFFKLLNRLIARKVTGNAALVDIEQVAWLFDSDVWNTLLAPTLRKDLRVGASIDTFNKILKNTQYAIPVFKCQKATDSKKYPQKMVGQKLLEPKFDGVRVLTTVDISTKEPVIAMYSSTGHIFKNFQHIADQIRDNISMFTNNTFWHESLLTAFVLDGEIVSDSFQTLMKQVHRKTDVDISDATYHIFDIIHKTSFERGQWNVSQRIRSDKFLGTIACNINDKLKNIKIIQGIYVDLDTSEGKSVMERYADDMIQSGYEGIMIKDCNVPYECKRSFKWLKWKPDITVDLEVVD